jgi:hypothetical protein
MFVLAGMDVITQKRIWLGRNDHRNCTSLNHRPKFFERRKE